ncbi:DUF1330 domain-containing protein [Hyphomonas sp.]|uniref:DUF1330 domain-containing protein n=1 Tax=Hyphomonas sp. TaxID=87 RepID=UPI00391A2309
MPTRPQFTRALLAAALFLAACASPGAPAPAPVAAVEAPPQNSGEDPGVYMIVLGTVFDRPAFMAGYAAKLPPLYERFGGRYVALTGQPGILEGTPGFESVVMSHWPSEAAVRGFWTSEEYEQLIRDRTENGWGEFTVVIVPALPSAR